MKKRLLFILSLIFCLGSFASAQTKTVTNSDLEKFRQKRLQAEKDYNENAKRLGFPTARELAERNKQNTKELIEFSERLRAERLENERIEAAQAQIDAVQTQNNYLQSLNNTSPQIVERNYYYGYSPYVYYGGRSAYGGSWGIYYNNGWSNYYNNRRGNYNRRNYWGNRMQPIRPPKPIRPSFPLYYKPVYPPPTRRGNRRR
jgi:hypothetical protein